MSKKSPLLRLARAIEEITFIRLQDGVISAPQRRSIIRRMIDRLGPLDHFSLHLKICGGITVRCGDTGVPKPLADCEDVDAGSQQVYRRAVAHAVRV